MNFIASGFYRTVSLLKNLKNKFQYKNLDGIQKKILKDLGVCLCVDVVI